MDLLSAAEVRVLGVMIEKEATTPEYYPLSSNALVTGCNQRSNREPVVNYDEHTILTAVEQLRAKSFALVVQGSGRVTKYAQRISETLNLGRRELAALCPILLRGPQTLGEVKDRSERIFAFSDLEEVERVLTKLAEWPGGQLVKKLERQAGQKEPRYAHLLAGEPVQSEQAGAALRDPGPSRISQLEAEVSSLRNDLTSLQQRFEDLEAQLR